VIKKSGTRADTDPALSRRMRPVTATHRPLRWGIIGTGRIARTFAAELAVSPDAALAAVGSRTTRAAAAFAAGFPGARAHGSWADLVGDDQVDAVYVATPHPWHAEAALLAIRAGRHVLVEKPFTMDAHQARDVVAAARAAGVFCLEAMWTRFLPHSLRIRHLVAEGAIGRPVTLTADIGQWFPPDPTHRLFAPSLGGGVLLDMGVYLASWSSMLLGRPHEVLAGSEPAFTGVDGTTSIVLGHPGGARATLTCTLAAATPCRSFVAGTEGVIEVEPRFYAPTAFTLRRRDGLVERFETPAELLAGPGKGLRFQAAEVALRVRRGETESPHLQLDETIAVMETLDEARRQIAAASPSPSASSSTPG
jgi:predicted dehydrogenase